MAEPKPFKDLVDEGAVRRLADLLVAATPSFPAGAFVAAATPGLPPLELKDRVRHAATALRAHLPPAWPDAVAVLVAGLPPALDGTDGVSSGFFLWPVLTCVEEHGVDHPAESLAALHAMTKRFSAEFAVRPFLERHPALTLATLATWVADPDPHVRRLVSEGTRPRLPWGRRLPALQADPGIALPLLDRLVDDPELYVRRSVANHLGDIGKDHPAVAVATAARWLAAPHPDRAWIARHGLRTLVKAGHPGALAVLGFHPAPVAAPTFTVTPDPVAIGDTLTLAATVTLGPDADGPTRVVVDYAVRFARPSGRPSRKVFKGTVLTLAPGESAAWSTRHALRDVSIRAHHPGEHGVELLLQGAVAASVAVTVVRGE